MAQQVDADDPPVVRRRGPLIGLVAAEAGTMLGHRMNGLAIPWLVLVTTGSPAKMGIVGGATALASVLSSIFGAPLVDRFGMRKVAVTADLIAAAALAGVAAGYDRGFWLIVVLVTISGAVNGVGVRAKRVLLQPVAEAAGTPMARVTAIYDGLSRTATLVGASLAGVLIAWRGPWTVIWIDVVAFIVCATTVATVVRLPSVDLDETGTGGRREPYFTALRGGFAHLRQDRLMFGMVSLLFVTNLVNQAVGTVLLPLWAHQVLNSPIAFGLIGSAFAGGAVFGNVVVAVFATKLPRYTALAVGYLIGGAPRFLVLLFSDDLAVILPVMFICGVGISAVNPIYGALLYERTPKHLQARFFGVTHAITTGGMPLGGLLGGWTAAVFGLTGGLIAAGVLYTGATLLPVIRRRTWRDEMNVKPAPAADRAAAIESG